MRTQRGNREERHEADHRQHLQRPRRAIRHVQHVVVEAVFLVPQALAVEGGRDEREVFEELDGQVLVGPVVLGERE